MAPFMLSAREDGTPEGSVIDPVETIVILAVVISCLISVVLLALLFGRRTGPHASGGRFRSNTAASAILNTHSTRNTQQRCGSMPTLVEHPSLRASASTMYLPVYTLHEPPPVYLPPYSRPKFDLVHDDTDRAFSP
ncbi:hypothetical protein A0H81_08466 [Grifola frondosa]|uniref:Uncharacterized protein n=1 Tax=Grifola frondosa TaxID=5627 RepID=A0A1C7M393_GRIFR|nr:hypothetical protein A0H81_08466 [Grifola frondosa]